MLTSSCSRIVAPPPLNVASKRLQTTLDEGPGGPAGACLEARRRAAGAGRVVVVSAVGRGLVGLGRSLRSVSAGAAAARERSRRIMISRIVAADEPSTFTP